MCVGGKKNNSPLHLSFGSSALGTGAANVAAGRLESPSRLCATPPKPDTLENPPGGQAGKLHR